MALIKHAHSTRLTKQAVVLDMADLNRQAQRILAGAREQAETILRDARTEAQRLIDGAEERGYRHGLERGRLEGIETGKAEGRAQAFDEWRQQCEQVVRMWNDALATWEKRRDDMFLEARENVIQLAVILARKVVHRTLQVDRSIVADQIAEALRLVGKTSSVDIVIHPDDRAQVEQVLPSLLERINSGMHSQIRDDVSVTPGGCVIATAGGRVDATIETQLDRIAEAFAIDPQSTEA